MKMSPSTKKKQIGGFCETGGRNEFTIDIT
jgi:hypothetical protein